MMKKYLIIPFLLIGLFTKAQFTCSLNFDNNLPEVTINSPTSGMAINNFSGKKIIIEKGNLFDSPMKFENCLFEVKSTLLYNTPGKIEFYYCKFEFYGLTSIRATNGFAPNPVEFIVDNCCFNSIGIETFHVEEGAIKFTNNVVNNNDIEGSHTIHLKNLDHTKDNSFYGNRIYVAIGSGITIDDVNFTKFGDNSKVKNRILTYQGNGIHSFTQPKFNNLSIENTEFESTRSEFFLHTCINLKFGKISIDNCKIKNAFAGISTYGSNLSLSNTDIENCIFGLHLSFGFANFTYEPSFIVKSSSFTSCDKGIYLPIENPKLFFAQISDNNFINNDIDLMTQGGSINGYNISQNNFSGKDYGILIDGDNAVDIENNTFVNSYAGTIMNATGDNTNNAVYNNFNSLLVGAQTQGDNNMFMALENCFNTGAGDLYLDGSVNRFMGNIDVGAGNCFTKNTVPDISAVTNVFEYYWDEKDDLGLCYEPVTISSYKREESIDRNNLNCGSTNPISPTVKWDYCYPRKKLTCEDIEYYLLQVQNEINYTTNSTSFTSNNKANILIYLKACKFRLIKLRLFNCYPDVPTPQDLELGGSQRLKDKADMVAMAIESSNFSLATTLLNSFSDNSEEGLDYKFVQQLNVQRLTQGPAFVLSNADRNALLTIANKSQSLTGYARGLYYILAGEIIMPNITRYAGEPRSRKDKDVNSESIYPNPFRDYLDLSSLSKEGVSSVSIVNSFGVVIINVVKMPDRINTVEWNAGLYIVNIIYNDKSNKIIKLVK